MAYGRGSRNGRRSSSSSYRRRAGGAQNRSRSRSGSARRNTRSGGRKRSYSPGTIKLVVQMAGQDANTSAFGQQVPTATGRARF